MSSTPPNETTLPLKKKKKTSSKLQEEQQSRTNCDSFSKKIRGKDIEKTTCQMREFFDVHHSNSVGWGLKDSSIYHLKNVAFFPMSLPQMFVKIRKRIGLLSNHVSFMISLLPTFLS